MKLCFWHANVFLAQSSTFFPSEFQRPKDHIVRFIIAMSPFLIPIFCIGYFSLSCNKISDKKQIKEKYLLLFIVWEDTTNHWQQEKEALVNIFPQSENKEQTGSNFGLDKEASRPTPNDPGPPGWRQLLWVLQPSQTTLPTRNQVLKHETCDIISHSNHN